MTSTVGSIVRRAAQRFRRYRIPRMPRGMTIAKQVATAPTTVAQAAQVVRSKGSQFYLNRVRVPAQAT
ncbi:MAG TPA: hypothetical protein VG253_25655 [Streptosporangiaceae bacterium]|nr:hypothetical protein [Streptosporangiaceae bacterium]